MKNEMTERSIENILEIAKSVRNEVNHVTEGRFPVKIGTGTETGVANIVDMMIARNTTG